MMEVFIWLENASLKLVIFVDKEISPIIVVNFYLDICYRLESSSISSYKHYLFDSNNINYEVNP